MNINNRYIINEYKNYLIKNIDNSTEINRSIKSINDIKRYKEQSIIELKKIEDLSKEYKLYDKNYEEFRIVMGKFALGLSKSFKLKLNDKEKIELTNEFINLNMKFEYLLQKNIIKDAYIWK